MNPKPIAPFILAKPPEAKETTRADRRRALAFLRNRAVRVGEDPQSIRMDAVNG